VHGGRGDSSLRKGSCLLIEESLVGRKKEKKVHARVEKKTLAKSSRKISYGRPRLGLRPRELCVDIKLNVFYQDVS